MDRLRITGGRVLLSTDGSTPEGGELAPEEGRVVELGGGLASSSHD